jgi:glucokinase
MLLAGDIGGTKVDLAVFDVEQGPRAPIARKRFPSRDYPSLEAIAREFLAEANLPVTHASFAVAGPVVGGTASLTNLPWVIEERSLQADLGLEGVSLLNDVEATAVAVPALEPTELHTVREGTPVRGGAIAVIAPGTGLGEAFLTWDGTRYHAHASEGSHTDFGPRNPREIELLKYSQTRWERVSYERVCAGLSIPHLYDFLRDVARLPEAPAVREQLANVQDRTPIIMDAAFDPKVRDPLCREALHMFVSILGAEAGNLALTVLATGGVYVSGGIPPRILAASPGEAGEGRIFLASFQDKGRLSPLLARMPVHIIVEPVALLGAAVHGLDLVSSPGRVTV